MNELDKLREWFPWPEESPSLSPNLHGWLNDDTKGMLRRKIPKDVQLIVEIGSWMGKSAHFIIRDKPDATLVCIDTWLGSSEHFRRSGWRCRLPSLFEQFLSNMWQYRERVIPVRATSPAGLDVLRLLKIRPDAFYVDGSHDAVDVQRDTELSAALNPAATIVGDDWTHESVRQGVQAAMENIGEGRLLHNNRSAWVIT